MAEGGSWRLTATLLALLLMAVGAAALADDADDLGRVDRVHHWLVGFTLIALSILLLFAVLWDEA
ncbi:MAG: hypothetical protein QXT37_08355 [Thermofilaceae archaeon]